MAELRRKEIHPLFNPTILHRIFEPLKVHNLKRIRLVCRSWNNVGSSQLQRKSKVTLVRGKEVDKKHLSYKNFLEYIETLPEDGIFFRNYHIEHWILNFGREKSLVNFWTLCGPTMRELTLKDIIFYEVETISSVFFTCTPYLESLTIVDCLFYTITQENLPAVYEGRSSHPPQNSSDEDEESYIFFDYYDHVSVEQLKKIDECIGTIEVNGNLRKFKYEQLGGEEFPLSWGRIFHGYPNMKECKIAAYTPASLISELFYVSTTPELDCRSILPKLSTLAFYPSSIKEGSLLVDEHMELLHSITFNQLTHLELTIGDCLSLNHVMCVINKNSKSLREVHLFRGPCDSIPHQSLLGLEDLVVLPYLRTLQVSLNLVGTLSNMIIHLGKIPDLKTLVVWDSPGCYNWEDRVDADVSDVEDGVTTKHPKVESISCGYRIKSVRCMEYLSQALIGLRSLEASLNDEQIRIVFRDVKALEELTVLDRYLTDEGITGNPILLSECTEWSPDVQREYPYIGDLKRLKRFVLKYWKYDGITDLSVYHGFLDVVNLSYLHLTNTKISNGALDMLLFKSSLITLLKTIDINSESIIPIKGDT